MLLNFACSPIVSNIYIYSNLVGSKVYINDKLIGVTPTTVQLVLGDYDVRVEKKGFVYQKRISIKDEAPQNIEANFNQAHFEVTSNRDQAEVYLDGSLIGVTPYKGVVEAGNHEVRVIKDGNYDYQKSLVFTAFSSVSVFAKLLEYKARIGGRSYPVARIGKLVWMAQNLKEKINTPPAQAMPSYYCENPCKDVFYTWSGAQVLAKKTKKWRLPTLEDWNYLVHYLGTKGVVQQLKPGGLSGFNSRPLGVYKQDYGLILEKGKTAYYWTANLYRQHHSETGAYSFEISYDKGTTRSFVHAPNLYFSVRYVRDW